MTARRADSAEPIHDTLRTMSRAPTAAPASSLTGTTTADGPWRNNHSGTLAGGVPWSHAPTVSAPVRASPFIGSRAIEMPG